MLQAASRFYAAQQRRVVEVLAAARAEWAKISKPADFDRIATRLQAILMAGQLGAATDGAQYVPAALSEQGYNGASPLSVNPAQLVGWGTILRSPGTQMPLDEMLARVPAAAELQGMAHAGRLLDIMAVTQIADAGRMSTGIGLGTRVRVGYYRHVNPPCCSDCAIQAGRFFRHNAGFARHPHCDCVHVPAYQDNPPEGYASLPDLDQITGLSEAERKAVEDGATLSMVVNARRGASRMFTSESTTTKGYAAYIRRAIDQEKNLSTQWVTRNVGTRGAVKNYTERRLSQRRLSPEGIYNVARNQEEAVRLLIENGYVVGDINKLAKRVVAEMARTTY